MAFAVKYRMDWTDSLGQDSYRLDVETDGYGGSVIGLGHALDGFELTYNEGKWVQGFEGVFSFHIPQSSAAAYDADFYESEYKEFKVKFYINTVLKNVGWLKPENTTREVHYPEIMYRVSFTDALNDLKEIDYVNSTGSKDTLLQVIQRCLGFGGIEDLDLFIQCNLFEDQLMAETASLFKTFKVHDKAFWNVSGSEKVWDNCFEVLEKCIKPFYCRLAQVNGYWQITNGQEYASQRDIYAIDDLAAVSENQAYDREVNIDDFDVVGSKFELTKLPPIRTLKVFHRNKNIGTNELSNSGFDSGTADWNNGDSVDAWTVFNVSGGRLIVSDNVGTGNPNEDKSFSSDPFNIADIGDGDGFFNWTFQLELKDIEYSSGNINDHPPYINVRLNYPDGSYIDSGYQRILEGDNFYTLNFAEKYPVDQTGDYFLTIMYQHPDGGTLNLIELSFDDIEVTQDVSTADTSDQSYSFTSDVPGYLKEEEDLHFADGSQADDVGVLMDASNDYSSSWTRYGFSGENESLISQFGKQYLNDRRGYFDRLTIEGLIDTNEEIHFNSILELGSKKYRFTEYSKNYKTKQISGTLQQVKNDDDVLFILNIKRLLSKFGIQPPNLTRGGIPAATINLDGLITTNDQEFSGTKKFVDGLELGANTLLVTPISGRVEFDGTHFYGTVGGLRKQLDQQAVAGQNNPTAVLISNVDNAGSSQMKYIQTGDVVSIEGTISINATTAGVLAVIALPLPIGSNFSSVNDAHGTITSQGVGYGTVDPDTVNDRLILSVMPTTDTLQTYKYTGKYTIKS